MTKYAFVFPGQGSQAVGMLAELANTYPIVKQTFAEASEQLGYDLWQLTQAGPEESLNQTDKTQPAMLAAGVSVWRVWSSQTQSKPIYMAGHSFGEYSALTCAEAISYPDAVLLAQARGRFMRDAVAPNSGAVAAVLGLDDEALIEACKQAAQGQIVAAVNFNAPGQVVVAGEKAAVERAIALAKTAGAKKAILLPVSVPVHCDLMRPAAEKMAEQLAQVTISPPTIPVIHNVDVATHADAINIRQALVSQIYSPVRWTETVQYMVEQGVTTLFEGGPGKVLAGLTKRIAKDLQSLPIYDLNSLEQALQRVEQE
ncbi:ACP S-malonyltransferase [Beggiatoa leptomitoformis]|uniref:Malonyl CoA-acyl carrier protein transacylase n=1 Tax=Beggiatoa leptomitoformis TaxID=288004 RepID=A0A2N9YEE2_9GAMM|nr:ACP S-malonyltransferase [Beggiatoa leptomitoformis]ALG68771.1 ACP S-malonyltransferase [Beggiatoa leptomitoformis]AUI68868.1 ACP S-malonyltransferase [Beggiatoa leptomitoformis]